jgi:hypothetical protein
MCHHIEDPTFDATAWATDPRARMRPLHRPPRVPADRHPHCHWVVTIDPEVEPLPEPEPMARVAGTRAARLPLAAVEEGGDGRSDYVGPLEPDLRFEAFTPGLLRAVLDEVCLQGHLLALSFADAVARRFGGETAVEVGVAQFTGIAGVAAQRLVRALGLGPSLAGVAALIEAHPAFRPRAYVDLRVEVEDDRVVVALGDCPALEEELAPSWPALLAGGAIGALDAVVQAVDPRARTTEVGWRRWAVAVDESAPAASEPPEVTLTKFSTGADFTFRPR